MRDNMHEDQWSPFDPKWYANAFDKYISTADELFNTNEIIKQGYVLPDSDGSESSVFRREAVLNNSFNESALRETLKDIYLNNSHRLIASNHDNVHFYKWIGSMADVNVIPNTNQCEITIPVDSFLDSKSRDKYKLSQFSRKWIDITEIRNNWDVFKFDVMLFINQRTYSEYSIRMDDCEVTIRFRYHQFWIDNNYPIYLYKYDTSAQCRIKVSQELIVNQWNWHMPVEHISDSRVLNFNHIMVSLNRISDESLRTNDIDTIDVMGDNLEFLTIKDGYVDLSKMSDYNKHLIITDADQWYWMSISVPKFMHEYPILLPTDVIYRPYEPKYMPVKAFNRGIYRNVLTDKSTFETNNQVYINMDEFTGDMNFELTDDYELIVDYDREQSDLDLFIDENGYLILNSEDTSVDLEIQKWFFELDAVDNLIAKYTWNDGWLNVIRPIVLADAFDDQVIDPYDKIISELSVLTDLTTKGADYIESFRTILSTQKLYHDEFIEWCDGLIDIITQIYEAHNGFLKERRINFNDTYDATYKEFLELMDEIKLETDSTSIRKFQKQHMTHNDFWGFISPLIYIPRDLCDKFYISTIVKHIGSPTVWESGEFSGKLRFSHPVEVSDFWTFEYDHDANVWRPYELNIEHHFPDVYLLTDPKEEYPTENRVFKAFFFYSDTMNTRNIAPNISRATASWDDDMNAYETDKQSIYRDIFMEKFYWMGVRSIYEGILTTKYRWEVIEYIHKNPSYDRFNDLFLNTMDPYFKLGLSTYLKSDHYQFPFDDAIAKLNEALSLKSNGYDKVTNFEMYLNKTWIPQYFDYVDKIMDDWNPTNHLIRRPRISFDTKRLLPTLEDTQYNIHGAVTILQNEIDSVLEAIKYDGLEFATKELNELKSTADGLESNLASAIKFIRELDLDIYSIDDVNRIILYIEKHYEMIELIKERFSGINKTLGTPEVYDVKIKLLESISEYNRNALRDLVFTIGNYIQEFNVAEFMTAINDPDFQNRNNGHEWDESLLGMINQFTTAWPADVKEARTALYVSSNTFWAFYDESKSYSTSEIEHMCDLIDTMYADLQLLEKRIYRCWDINSTQYDTAIVDRFVYCKENVDKFIVTLTEYLVIRKSLFELFDTIRAILIQLNSYGLVSKEEIALNTIDESFENILSHVSYIAGQNHKDEAMAEYTKANTATEYWLAFVQRNKAVFERLHALTATPNTFISTLDPLHQYLDAMVEYMKTVDREYIPDSDHPTYSAVYDIKEIELTSGGYLHKVGDIVFVPNLGVYKVTEVEGFVSKATALQDMNYVEPTTLDFTFEYRSGNLYVHIPDDYNIDYENDKVVISNDMYQWTYRFYVDEWDELWVVEPDDLLYAFFTEDGDLIIESDDYENADMEENGYLIIETNDLRYDEFKFTVDNEGILSIVTMTKYDIDIVNDELIITLPDNGDAIIDHDGCLLITYNEESSEIENWHVREEDGCMMLKIFDQLTYRTTSFRDPCIQSNLYDTITNGEGLGITVKAKSSTKRNIINDSVITRYIDRIKNVIDLIRRDIYIINPYNNNAVEETVKKINRITDDWDYLMSFYYDNMSYQVKKSMQLLMEVVRNVIDPLEYLMETREKNDVHGLLVAFEKFIDDMYNAFLGAGMVTPNYIYFDNRIRLIFKDFMTFYGNGTTWNDADMLFALLETTEYELKLFNRKMLVLLPPSEKKSLLVAEYNGLITFCNQVRTAVESMVPSTHEMINAMITHINESISQIPTDLQQDKWYNLKSIAVAEEGEGYEIGDIVEIIPELPTTTKGDLVYDDEEIILGEKLYAMISKINENGGVTQLEPLIEYALPYQVIGLRSTITRVGNGIGLKAIVTSVPITIKDSTLFLDESSDIAPENQFDRNDLFTFKFPNIYDLDINYEVFYNGRQIRDYVLRHEYDPNPLHPNDVDVIYLKANDVMALANSSVYIEGENYFVYRINSLEIIDAGAGYSEGQEIIVNADQVALKLKIASLVNGPFKGIGEIELMDNDNLFNGMDPSTEYGKVSTDSLNNIDDEYNNGYYDTIPAEGIIKPATFTYNGTEYTFTSRRFDNLPDGNRNANYMYPDINGDYQNEDGKYLGHRVDNSILGVESNVWNGIDYAVPVTDGIIAESDRVPTGEPANGEYQNIASVRFHYTETAIGDSIPTDKIASIISDAKTSTETPGNIKFTELESDGIKLIPIDYNRIAPLMRNLIDAIPNPGPFVDSVMVNVDVNKVIGKQSSDDTEIYGSVVTAPMMSGDLTVKNHASLPTHINEWKQARVGRCVIVENDETMHGHRTSYKVRTFIASGYIIYEMPEVADFSWNCFDVDWAQIDFYPDMPTTKAQYPDADWNAANYAIIQHSIDDGKVDQIFKPKLHHGSYIHNLTTDDLSVYNYTLHKWEDLSDTSRWRLDVRESPEEGYGFKLTFLLDGYYSYDMRLFLNKVPETQMRNAELKRDAVFKITSEIVDEVNTRNLNISVNTGRHLRIRRLYPYEQKESYTIGRDALGHDLGYEMNFKLAPYIHYKNEIHLEDVCIYNKTLGRYEDLLDPTLFEVRFKDDKAKQRGYETQTIITQSIIANSGEGFVDGYIWGWNEEFKIHIFGYIETDYRQDGTITSFTPLHVPNPPTENMALEFQLYQYATAREVSIATVVVEFKTEKIEVYGDGWLHNVTNRLAPVPKEFKVICQYDLDEQMEYEIRISKTPKTWAFVRPEWEVFPTFKLENEIVNSDCLYIMTDRGRFPLVNPATGHPSFRVSHDENSTNVTFLNVYQKYEHIEVHSTPYPMRSVYTQRRVPSSGYVDLTGKLNKPLNKKYYEFWMNGRLLYDEVTIISPTKLFLHGLKSLRNFEIIEINRDPNEYFSDNFLSVDTSELTPKPVWNFNTYLDDALTGNLPGDNYTTDEQSYLLEPVWNQVERDHPEYKNYPPNMDTEDDILMRVDEFGSFSGMSTMPIYQFTIVDLPSIEGVPIVGNNVTFESFGFRPITEEMLIDMMNEEWKEEIDAGIIPSHSILSDNEWYGIVTAMYNEYGKPVNRLDDAAYTVSDDSIIRIDTATKASRVIHKNKVYDLT